MLRIFRLVLPLLLLAGCMQDMADQPRYEPYEESPFFDNQQASRPLPAGVVARGFLHEDTVLYQGRSNGELSQVFPMLITRQVLDRGRDRYNIYCTPCHDHLGTGMGMAVIRGFRRGLRLFTSTVCGRSRRDTSSMSSPTGLVR